MAKEVKRLTSSEMFPVKTIAFLFNLLLTIFAFLYNLLYSLPSPTIRSSKLGISLSKLSNMSIKTSRVLQVALSSLLI